MYAIIVVRLFSILPEPGGNYECVVCFPPPRSISNNNNNNNNNNTSVIISIVML